MPTSDNAYYYANNPFYKSGYGLPNCTCYAFGRAWEVTGKYPKLSTGNAGEWYAYNRSKNYYPYGTTPEAGSIACWSGHVAFVESVNSNGTINFSESNWSGRKDPAKKFRYQTNKNPYSYTSGFQGYIYVVDGGGGSDTTAPTITDASVSCISNSSFNINATLNDNVGVTRGWVVVYGPAGEKQYGITAGNGFFYHTIFTKDHGGAGLYSVHLYVYDNAGNSAKITYDNIDIGGMTTPKINLSRTVLYKGDKFRITWDATSASSDFYQYWVVIDNKTTGNRVFEGSSGAAGDVNANYYDFTATSTGEYGIGVYAVPYNNKDARQKYYYTTFKVTDAEMTTPAITLNKQSYFVGDTVNISWEKSSSDSDFYQYWVVIDNKTTDSRVFGGSPGTEGDVNANHYSFVPPTEGNYKIDVYSVPYYNKDARQKVTTKTITVTKECIHDYSSKTATSAYLKSTATCTSAAVYYYKCANCSEKSTDTYKYGSALGHTGGTANCIDKAVCTRCNTAYGSVNSSNHKSVVKDSAVAATCTKTGLTEGKHCSACGKTITAQTVIPAKGHTESDWISDANGAKHTECTVCHVALSTKNCEHAETKNAVTNPTCIKPGSIITVCELCGEKLDEKKIAPLGHKISTTVTPATLSKNGKNVQKCSVCGETVNTTEICRISKTALSKTSYTYNGKVQKPAVSVKDSAGKALKIGTDYTVEYSGGCQSSGTYTVTVKFKGNYSGKQKLTYRIVLNAPAELKATRQKASYITLSWSKVSGATGYSVYQYNAKTKKYEKVASSKGNTATVKNLKAGKSYSFKVVALGKDNSLNSAFSKKITVGTSPVAPVLKAKSATKTAGLIWKKISGANSYTVYYSTKKNGTYKKLKTVKGNSYTAKKPIAGKTYYYKVVATAKIAGRTLTSGYSNIVKG